MPIATEAMIERYRADGCVSLGQVLDHAEVRRWTQLFDANRSVHSTSWRMHGAGACSLSADVLATAPAFDGLVRHPAVLPVVAGLLGGPACFWETSLRHVAALSGPDLPDSWHRDSEAREHWLQAMVLLTEVAADCHCLAVVPRAHGAAVQPLAEERLLRPEVECLGAPGTVWLFNPDCWHTVRLRGRRERKSLQTYYCLAERPLGTACSAHCVVPRQLWMGADPSARDFYRLAPLGQRTRLMAESFALADG
jgi:hypothetical protein